MESDDIKNAVYRVTKKVGYTGPEIRPIPYPGMLYAEMMIDGVKENWGDGRKYHRLLYAAGATKFISIDEIEASIAHEIGHVVNGDTTIHNMSISHEESRLMEIRADQFAARYGYGDKLKSFLARVKETPHYEEGITHPTYVDRVKAIEEVQSSV